MADTSEARWSAERVLTLAPDASVARAARGLTADRRWSDEGVDADGVVWGRCQGGGSSPYQVVVDPREPAFHCSCPSRKIPCKHVLGALLRWSAGSVHSADPPAWVRDWLSRRAARAARGEATAGRPREPNPKTAARRADRVASGMAELDRWLVDQVRPGIAGLTAAGYEPFDTLAKRLVDAQAPGAAGLVRRLASAAVSGSSDRLVADLGLLRLLVAGYERRERLPAALAATVAGRVGLRVVSTEEVLKTPAVSDVWAVVGVREEMDERRSTRRVWLRGCDTGRPALLLSYAGPGQFLAGGFVPGTAVAADLCFYPGATALRAQVAGRADVVDRIPRADTIARALDGWAAALAGDPWLDRWPMLLEAVVPTPTHAVESEAAALPLTGENWPLIAAAGGRPCRLMGEYGDHGLRPVTAWVDGRVIAL